MIAIVLGTRAELIKTFPIMLELQKQHIPYYFIHTGQHNLKDLCKKFKVKAPDTILTTEPNKSTKFYSKVSKALLWNFKLIFKIRKELKKIPNLSYVIYHGDTMTTASAAIASSKLFNPRKTYKNVHLEAGLRSGNLKEPFPEEISRIIADKFSDILIAVSTRAKNNLEKEHRKGKILLMGNTIIDAAKIAYHIAKKKKIKSLSQGKFALISIHRHENIKSKERLEKIINILLALNIQSYFTLHDNTKQKLIKFKLYEKLKQNKNIKIIKPLDYISFIYQLSRCSLIVCDGGSMQEESLIFKKPCIILRKYTERQEGLSTGINFLTKLDVQYAKKIIKKIENNQIKIKNFKNPYGEIGLSRKIVNVLK